MSRHISHQPQQPENAAVIRAAERASGQLVDSPVISLRETFLLPQKTAHVGITLNYLLLPGRLLLATSNDEDFVWKIETSLVIMIGGSLKVPHTTTYIS